jgi:hypothetical protein
MFLERRGRLWTFVRKGVCHFVCMSVTPNTGTICNFCHTYYSLLSFVMSNVLRSKDITWKYSTVVITVSNYLPLDVINVIKMQSVNGSLIKK